MNEIPQNVPEQPINVYLTQLRKALDSKDATLLGSVINGIQRNVQGTDRTSFSPLDDEDIRTLLETGRAEINVGTGTHGQRIYIKDAELHMPPGGPRVEKAKVVIEQRMNFKRLFDLPLDLSDTEDLRVRF
ncbi:MAG: hypothetical protein V4467_03425 [Patescibacteria group bacterium]